MCAVQWVSPNILGTVQKAVLGGIAERARDDGTDAWPDIEELAHKGSIHERTVQTTLRKLEEAGWITTSIQSGAPKRAARYRPNEYTLNVKKLRAALNRTYAEMVAEGRGGRFPEILAPMAGVAQDHPWGKQSGVAQDHPSPASGVAQDHPHRNCPSGTSPSSLTGAAKAAAPKRPRMAPASRPERTQTKRDELFEAVAEVCGIDWQAGLTAAERGKINAAVAQLRAVGATPEEVRHRAERGWRRLDYVRSARQGQERTHPTPNELAAHWGEMGRFAGQRQTATVTELRSSKFRPCGRPVEIDRDARFKSWLASPEGQAVLWDERNLTLDKEELFDAAWDAFQAEGKAVAL